MFRFLNHYLFISLNLLFGFNRIQFICGESNVGCFFSSSLCEKSEICFDDGAFGRCTRSVIDEEKHSLSDDELSELEREMKRLFNNGYRWDHQYTQCVIRQILFAYKHHLNYDPGLCSRLLKLTQPDIPPEVALDFLTKENELASILFKNDHRNEYASEVFNAKQDYTDEQRQQDYEQQHQKDADDMSETEMKIGSDERPYFIDAMNIDNDEEARDDDENVNDAEDADDDVDEQSIDAEIPLTWSFSRQHRLDTKKPGPGPYLPSEEKKTLRSESRHQTLQHPLHQQQQQQHQKVVTKKINENNRKEMHQRLMQQKEEETLSSKDNHQAIDERKNYETIDATHAFVLVNKGFEMWKEGADFVHRLERLLKLPRDTFSNVRVENTQVTFKVNPNPKGFNASVIATKIEQLTDVDSLGGRKVETAGIGNKDKMEIVANEEEKFERLKLITIILASLILSLICIALLLYYYKRGKHLNEKLMNFNGDEDEEKGGRKKLIQNDEKVVEDYQDLCRQRYQNKENEKKEKLNSSSEDSTTGSIQSSEQQLMDVTTGHMILEFMEEYLKKPDYLDKEWESLCLYESDGETLIANLPENRDKNRFIEIVPYDSTRIILNDMNNEKKSDYINASIIYDCDPRHGLYILTQGPLKRTVCDFWQMIWEQNVYIIVCLTRLMENSQEMSSKYWPDEGSQIYFNYEIHLVSEHIWSDDYLVRSFYLKNLTSNETRTVTQFHYISWPQNSVPSSTKSLLEFRRKVNKSYRGRSSPILIHCSDGIGRSGTYCLLDMVLNRLAKGAKEMDIEATVEHIRDQRGGCVTSKQQFEFALKCVVDQVYQILQQMK